MSRADVLSRGSASNGWRFCLGQIPFQLMGAIAPQLRRTAETFWRRIKQSMELAHSPNGAGEQSSLDWREHCYSLDVGYLSLIFARKY